MTNIGVIGVGYWGKNLVRNFSELGVLSAVCETKSSSLERVAQEHPSVNRYEDVDDILNDTSVDAVAIATPAETHGEITRRALELGKHVFVEKPLCLDLSEANELKLFADAKDRILMVGHMMLYHPAFCALLAKVKAGDLGTLRYIYSTRLSLGKIRREENALWSFAPHDISMILALTEQMPSEVVANGEAFLRADVADTTLSHFRFSEQLQAHIFVSWLHPFKDHRMVVIGSDGMVVFDDVQLGQGKLMLYSHEVGWEGEIPMVNKAEGTPIPYGDEEPLRGECRHFISCIENRHRPQSDADEGIRVLSVLDACQRSLSTGRSVSL